MPLRKAAANRKRSEGPGVHPCVLVFPGTAGRFAFLHIELIAHHHSRATIGSSQVDHRSAALQPYQRKHHSRRPDLGIGQADFPAQLDTQHLKPNRIDRMVRGAHPVCFGITHRK